jgi:3-methylcrotonyl-CoA carboxylase alpha subunit
VAAGQPLPLRQDQLRIQGHALEARIYAENPDKDFLPSIGRLNALQWPPHVVFQTGPVRVDGGVREGDTISPHYDPMIAKLIVHGQDREQARQRMLRALGAVRATGVQTNIAFLGRLMDDPAFAAADLDTGLIEREHARLFPAPQDCEGTTLALAAAALLHHDGLARPGATAGADPWRQADGWRVGGRYERVLTLKDARGERAVRVCRDGPDWTLAVDDGPAQAFRWQAEGRHPAHVRVRLGDAETRGDVHRDGARLDVFADGRRQTLEWHDPLTLGAASADDAAGGLTAPMPGKILSVAVAAGDAVTRGTPLIVMEAMKMEHTIEAPHDGVVKEVFYAVGDQVTEGVTLIDLEAAATAEAG